MIKEALKYKNVVGEFVMDLYFSVFFFAGLVSSAFTDDKSKPFLYVLIMVALYMVCETFNERLVGAGILVVGIIIGKGVETYIKLWRKFYFEQIGKEYNQIMLKLPKFIELEQGNKWDFVFLVLEGEFTNHVFHITRTKKDQGMYVYSFLGDKEMMNLQATETSTSLGNDFMHFIFLREEYNNEVRRD